MILFNTSYGLLGASGCGKTTLLSCIVGQKKLQDGQISVLGTCLNTHSATTLGPRIGYMPQDIALVNELSIKETIYYFGRIYGMHDDRIRERFKILKDLLELPDNDRLVENLSGGQKRRVSFACALVHGTFQFGRFLCFFYFNCNSFPKLVINSRTRTGYIG